MALRFRPDGTFRILQITDRHEGPVADPRTAAFLAAALGDLRPDLVVHTGDAVAGDVATAADLVRALVRAGPGCGEGASPPRFTTRFGHGTIMSE
jgi:hypothetical protein